MRGTSVSNEDNKCIEHFFNPLSANPTKVSNTQTVRRLLQKNCLSVFDHFMGLALKGLIFLSNQVIFHTVQ